MKRALLTVLVLIALGGCTTLVPQLEIYPGNVAGMVDEDEGGFLVRWSISGGLGTLYVDFGDGEEGEFDQEGTLQIEHLYTQAGSFTCGFTRGRAHGSATVQVDAPGFDVNQPFWSQGNSVEKGEAVLFDPFPRQIGCDNGAPLYYTGVWPENLDDYLTADPFKQTFDVAKLSADFEMLISVLYSDGGRGFAHGKSGEEISGQWVSLQTFRIVADWRWAVPPYPLPMLTKGCSHDECDSDDECWEWIPPPSGTPWMLVRMEIRSKWDVHGAVQWQVFVIAGSCT